MAILDTFPHNKLLSYRKVYLVSMNNIWCFCRWTKSSVRCSVHTFCVTCKYISVLPLKSGFVSSPVSSHSQYVLIPQVSFFHFELSLSSAVNWCQITSTLRLPVPFLPLNQLKIAKLLWLKFSKKKNSAWRMNLIQIFRLSGLRPLRL